MATQSKITISKIGIETEMVIVDSLSRHPNNQYIDYKTVKVCTDDEYYNDQIEFKMFPETYGPQIGGMMDDFKEYIKSHKKSLLINGPNWVGTHIHLFLERSKKPIVRTINCKMRIVDYLLKEIVKFFSELVLKEDVDYRIITRELQRITHSHNIWRFFDTERMQDSLRDNLYMFGSKYHQFNGGVDRPKYAPVIWSLPNPETGKPLSLELRLFPNTFFFAKSGDEMKAILSNVEELVNISRRDTDEIRESMATSIRASHMKLVSAWRYMGEGNRAKASEVLSSDF